MKFDLDRPIRLDGLSTSCWFNNSKSFAMMREFELHTSNHFNGPYTLVFSGEAARQPDNTFTFGAATAQYWKLVVLSAHQISSLREQEGISTPVIIEYIRFHEALSVNYEMSVFERELTASTDWSDTKVTAPGLHGPWDNSTKSVYKTFTLPEHSQLRIQARFWALDSWEVGEMATLHVCDAGPTQNCMLWWSMTRGAQSVCDGSWSQSSDAVPNPWAGDHAAHKCYYDIDISKPHQGPPASARDDEGDITLVFGADLDFHSGDESWAFSNVTISIDSHGHDLTIDTDYESEDTEGVLTVAAGRTVTTNGRPAMITAFDVDLAGSLHANGLVSIHGALGDQTIALGSPATSSQMQLSDSELGRVTTTAGLSIGSSLTGTITVAGLSDGSTDSVATLTLLATKSDRVVQFNTNPSSFRNGIAVRANRGISVNTAVTTNETETTFITPGTVTVSTSVALSSSMQQLTITADNIEFQSGSAVSSSTVKLTALTPGRTIGVGTGAGDLSLDNDELGFITANLVTVGDSSNGQITVGGVTAGNTDQMGHLRLTALAPNTAVVQTTDCHFGSLLTLEASENILLGGATTSNGTTVLDAGTGTLTIATGKALSTSGSQLTITADDLDVLGPLNTGTAAVHLMTQTGRSIVLGTGAGQMQVEASEVQQFSSGGLVVGARYRNKDIRVGAVDDTASAGIVGVVTLLALTDGSRIMFDSGASTFHTLEAMADDGLEVGVSLTTVGGSFVLDGDIDDSSTADTQNIISIADAVTLTSFGKLTLENTDAASWLPSGTMQAAGALTLRAGSGVSIMDNLNLLATGTVTAAVSPEYLTGNELLIDADTDSTTYHTTLENAGLSGDSALVHTVLDSRSVGAGVLTVASSKLVYNRDSNIKITAYDLDLAGSLSSGTAAISIHASRMGQNIGLGVEQAGITLPASVSIPDLSLTDENLNRIVVGGSQTIGELVFQRAPEFSWVDSGSGDTHMVTSAITVSNVSRQYNVQPGVVVFGRHFLSNAEYPVEPSITSKYAENGQPRVVSQVYDMANDFLPIIEGYPRFEVPDIVSLGNDIVVTWYPDVRSERTSHQFDWVGLYRKGECKDENEDSLLSPPADLSVAETGHTHQCYLAWAYLEREQLSGTVSFSYEDYHVAGEYELRYFYGDSRDGQGYKCGLQPGTVEFSVHCVLRAKATSSVVTVVKSGPAESMEDIPGMESFTDPDDGHMYVSGF